MTRRSITCAFALLTLLLSASGTYAKPANTRKPDHEGYTRRGGKADKAVSDEVATGKKTKLKVIITFADGVTVRDMLRDKAFRDLANGHKMRRRFRGMTGFSAEMTPVQIDRWLKRKDIKSIAIDGKVRSSQIADSTPLPDPENPYATSADYDGQALRATLGLQPTDVGRGVGVAIVDSGIAPTPDLTGRISAFYDFSNGVITATAPNDGYGHGTHIAGLIAGSGAQSNGKYVGVATAARLIGLKVLDATGAGYSSDVIAAVEFATENKAALGIDVMNLSLGHPIYESAATDPLVQAIERAVSAGIVVVVSAGNHGMNYDTGLVGLAGLTSPGNSPSALTIGAARHKGTVSRFDDEVAVFSSRGPSWFDGFVKPDVLVPGQALYATAIPTSTLAQKPGYAHPTLPGYIKLSGTSMAAGVASGLVADIIDANRRDQGANSVLTPNTIKAILQFTAIPLVDDDPTTPAAFEQGTGEVNMAGALALTRAINPAAPLGSRWLETGVDITSTIGNDVYNWASILIWGNHLVAGNNPFWHVHAFDDHVVWGDGDDHIVWGEDDDHVVWGEDDDHIVWGEDDDHVVWGEDDDHIVWGESVDLVLEHVQALSDHLVWGEDDDHVVWGEDDDHVVWGEDDDHVVWGEDDDHVVWGESVIAALGL